MSTHKITPETRVPFPCWMGKKKQWHHYSQWPWAIHPFEAEMEYYSTNPPDQPPLDEPAPEGSLPVTEPEKCEVCGGDEPCSHDFDKIGWPTPATPSLQSVAEGAAKEIQAVFYKESWGAVIPNPATVKEILTRHFAPLLTAQEAETRDWIKWHGELQEKLQDAQAQIAERDERIGRLEKELKHARSDGAAVALEAYKKDLAALRTRCEELERDKERLDWLERNSVELYCAGLYDGTNAGIVCGENSHVGPTIRAAIDAASKEGQP